MVAGLGTVAGAALTACSSNDDPGAKPSAAPAQLAPDVAVATRALEEIRAVREAARRTLSRFPASRSVLTSLVALHRTHEATLVDAVPDRARASAAPAPYRVPRKREKALAALAAREQRLHDLLDRLAVQAESGQFARLLASMGAAIHQRLAGWAP